MWYWLRQRWIRYKINRKRRQALKELDEKIKREVQALHNLGRVLLVCALLNGCVTTRFSEVVLDADGSSSTTEYSANAIVPPFSKLEPSNHNLHYKWGENELSIGQFSEGIDSTPQIQALGATLEAFIALAPILAPLFQTPQIEGIEP